MLRVLFRVWFRSQRIIKNVQGIIQLLVQDSGYCSKYDQQRLVQDSAYYLNSVWFWIQGIIKKCPGYYSASDSGFSISFKIRSAASESGFSVLLNMSRVLFSVWFRIQRIIQKCHVRVLFSVWLTIQSIIQKATSSVWFRIQRIIKKCPGFYPSYGSVFTVLFKKCPGYYSESGSGLSVLFKNVQGIIQRIVKDSAYY